MPNFVKSLGSFYFSAWGENSKVNCRKKKSVYLNDLIPGLSVSKHTNLCVFVTFQCRTSGATRDGPMKHDRVELRLSWPFPFLLLLILPSAPFDQHQPPPFPSLPLPSSRDPVASHPSFLASNSSRPQSTVPNVLPGAGKHLHHRLHQSASEVWRAHCARVSRWQILSLTSRTHIF